MIGAVLATDMAKHFGKLGQFNGKLSSNQLTPTEGVDKEETIQWLFHLADISNQCKKWELCKKWTDLLFVEFFAQGDLEKQHKFPVS